MEIFGIKITVAGVVATVVAVTTLVCGVNLVKASINKKIAEQYVEDWRAQRYYHEQMAAKYSGKSEEEISEIVTKKCARNHAKNAVKSQEKIERGFRVINKINNTGFFGRAMGKCNN